MSRVWHWTWRVSVALLVLLALVAGAMYLIAKPAMGGQPGPFQTSAQWRESRFDNPQPMYSDSAELRRSLFEGNPLSFPTAPVTTVHTDVAALKQRRDLSVSWFGHSSTLVQLDGVNFLIDPVWSERVSPFSFVGPRRFFKAPVEFSDLPPIDFVIISHDHYDHLDKGTIERLVPLTTRFVVPLGVGAHLRKWGIGAERITELDWWSSANVAGLTVTATPARHHSGRLSPQSDKTLWAGYLVKGPRHSVFYSGDTGMHESFAEVGKRFAPIDIALIEIGQYSQAWPDWHIGPEQAVWASKLVGARTMFPVHYALFDLAPHAWTEPVERTLAAGSCQNVNVIAPTPGMIVDFTTSIPALVKWWPALPGRTAKQYPIISTKMGSRSDNYPVPQCVNP